MPLEGQRDVRSPLKDTAISVRRLVPGDETDLLAIRARALTQAPGAFASGPGDDRFEKPGFAAALLTDSESAVFGAFDGSIVGVVGLHPSGHRKTSHALDLWGMFVDAEYRRAGVARSLMTSAIDFVRSLGTVSHIRLTVTDAAPEAASLYRSLGFVECGYESDALRVDGVSIGETSMRLTLDAAAR